MTISAVYRNGHLEPKEPLTLEEGTEVRISIAPEPRAKGDDASLDHLFASLAEIAREAHPDGKVPEIDWHRGLAYEFDDET